MKKLERDTYWEVTFWSCVTRKMYNSKSITCMKRIGKKKNTISWQLISFNTFI